LVLVNAVYFHGRWKDPFEQTATVVRPFTLLSGAKPQCPFMSRSGSYKYLKGDGFQAIRLPYGSDRFAMYVVLPDAIDGLPALLRGLDRKEWSAWLGKMQPSEGSISLPRFKVEYGEELSKPLVALGMASAFAKADFSGMTVHRDLFISEVAHKTYVDVNEEGTEAAAATEVGVAASSAPMSPGTPFNMVVDHPFLCAIRDDKTGEILFLGAIYDPTAAE
jgi:serpin B